MVIPKRKSHPCNKEAAISATLLSKWCDQIWLFFEYMLGLFMLGMIGFHWSQWPFPKKLMGCLTLFLTLHVFEENTYPGGFPYTNNMNQHSRQPLVYPQNRLTNMWTNLGCTLVFVLMTFLAPSYPAPCMTVIAFFGVGECINHTRAGIAMYHQYKDQGKRTIYGPGLINSYCCLLPLSLMAFYWFLHHSFEPSGIVIGLVIVFCIIFIGILIPFRISTRIKSPRFAFKTKGYFARFK